MDQLIDKLKRQIIDELNLDDIEPEEIETSQPLFGEALDLDSIDALSLIVILERDYGIKIEDQEKGIKILYSVETIAKFIEANR